MSGLASAFVSAIPDHFLFPSDLNPTGHQRTLNTAWQKTLRRAGVPYFRNYDLRSTYATRLSAGGVADEWVIQLLRQGDSHIFKKYSQIKLQMKREALEKINRRANEMALNPGIDSRTAMIQRGKSGTGRILAQFWHSQRPKWLVFESEELGSAL